MKTINNFKKNTIMKNNEQQPTHTPGEQWIEKWNEATNRCTIIDGENKSVCLIVQGPKDMDRAKLIAAAPATKAKLAEVEKERDELSRSYELLGKEAFDAQKKLRTVNAELLAALKNLAYVTGFNYKDKPAHIEALAAITKAQK